MKDIQRKAPWYGSDFSDGLSLQCLSAILYIYLATVTNAITFGGMLGDATDNMQVCAKSYNPFVTAITFPHHISLRFFSLMYIPAHGSRHTVSYCYVIMQFG